MWGRPSALDPAYVCGAATRAESISETYCLRARGERLPCLRSSELPMKPQPIDSVLTLVIAQDPHDLTQGSVRLTGTGSALIDERVLPAQFTRRRLSVHVEDSNLPSSCLHQNTLQLSYDLEGFGSQELRLDEVDTPACTQADAYCKGYVQLQLSPLD
jgi:hypothetical protein